MKKIGIFGPHGSGKTTLAYSLAHQAKLKGINCKVISGIARSCPFPLNQEFTKEAALWISSKIISEELEAQSQKYDLIISDRTPYDSVVYLKAKINKSNFSLSDFYFQFDKFAEDYLSSYNQIFYLYNDTKQISSDSHRTADKEFLETVTKYFEEQYENFIKKNDVLYETLSHVKTSQIFKNEVFLDL